MNESSPSEQAMTHPSTVQASVTEISLASLVVSGLAELGRAEGSPPELSQLSERLSTFGPDWRRDLWQYLEGAPSREDAPLFELRDRLGLVPIEVASVALALAVERDTRVSHLVSGLQAPVETVGPTLGLLEFLFGRDPEGRTASAQSLLRGARVRALGAAKPNGAARRALAARAKPFAPGAWRDHRAAGRLQPRLARK